LATKITVLVDNRAERSGLATEHGLSLWIEHGDCKILFDTGASGRALLANAEALGIELADADAICLSHGHLDHTGGLAAALPRLAGADLYAHPRVFAERFSHSTSGWHSIGMPLSPEEIERAGVLTHVSENPTEVCPGARAVERDESLVPPTPHLYARGPAGRVPDTFPDDQVLVLEVGEGTVVVSGCAHGGIANHCRAAQRHVDPEGKTARGEIVAVVGGFHLEGTPRQFVEATIEGLRRLGVRRFFQPVAAGAALEFPD